MTALVTGVKGFIGSTLRRELLSRGVDVYGVDIDGWDRNPPSLTPGAVFYHLAWVGKSGPQRCDWKVQLKNVEMALEYYEKAKALGCSRFICAGTIGEKMLTLPECTKLHSQNRFYVNSKCYLHKMLNNFEQGSCKVIWAMLGNLYGKGVAGGNILDYEIRTLIKGAVADFGPGEQPYDFINVSDAIRALALIGFGENVVSDEFYVGSGNPRPLKDYLLRVGELVGHPELVRVGSLPDDGTRFCPDWFSIDRLTAETGFVPSVGFDEGILANLKYLATSAV